MISQLNQMSLSDLQSDLLPKTTIKCSQGNFSTQFCINDLCKQQNIFLCSNQCTCRISHQKCQKAPIAGAMSKIKLKIRDQTCQFREKLYQTFNSIIDQLSDFRDSTIKKLDELNQMLKYNKLSRIQRLFYVSASTNESIHNFTSISSKAMWQDLNVEDTQGSKQTNSIFHDLGQYMLNFKALAIGGTKKMRSYLDKFCHQFQERDKNWRIEAEQQLKIDKKFNSLEKHILSSSSIVTTRDQVFCLIKMFEQRKLKDSRIIFKASQHNFQMSTYFQKCGKQTNTLIICRTNKDKIIGGFTPLSHEFTGEGFVIYKDLQKQEIVGQFVQDKSRKSFLFSLSINAKFQLNEQYYYMTIFRCHERDPIAFGQGSQLYIVSNADILDCNKMITNWFDQDKIKKSSYSNFNSSESRLKEQQDQNQMIKLTGNTTPHFTIKQWEVWKMQFQIEQQDNETVVSNFQESNL